MADAYVFQQFLGASLDGGFLGARGAGRNTAPSTPAQVRMWRPIITFSIALRLANRRMFWNVRARPACATSCGFLPDMDAPLNVQLPSSGM